MSDLRARRQILEDEDCGSLVYSGARAFLFPSACTHGCSNYPDWPKEVSFGHVEQQGIVARISLFWFWGREGGRGEGGRGRGGGDIGLPRSREGDA